MEPQSWRNLGIEGRAPTPAVAVMAAVQFDLLSQQHGTVASLTAATAIVALDCVRIRRSRRRDLRTVEMRARNDGALANRPRRR